MSVDEIKTVPYTPLSHPFIERLIGTVRREYLDHTLFWNRHDLQKKLDTFKEYYNDYRVHAGLNGKTPLQMIDEFKLGNVNIDNYTWESHCRGLFQTPVTA